MEDSETMAAENEGFWGLVEIFGHQQIAGFVGSQTIGGQAFVRVDVPPTSKQAAWSKLYGAGAIYAITPMAEDLVKQKAEVLQVAPLTAWDLPEEWRAKIKGLPAPMLTQDPDQGYDDDSDSEFE
jgi:hypothetical protein